MPGPALIILSKIRFRSVCSYDELTFFACLLTRNGRKRRDATREGDGRFYDTSFSLLTHTSGNVLFRATSRVRLAAREFQDIFCYEPCTPLSAPEQVASTVLFPIRALNKSPTERGSVSGVLMHGTNRKPTFLRTWALLSHLVAGRAPEWFIFFLV